MPQPFALAALVLALVPLAQDEPVLEDADVWGEGVLRGPFSGKHAEVPPPIVPERWVVVDGDALEGERLLARQLADPGAQVGEGRAVDDPRALESAAFAVATVTVEQDEVRMARLTGAELLLVNGEPFFGDPERRGYRGVPVPLRAGENRLAVARIRGGFELELWAPRTTVVISTWDVRAPQLGHDPRGWYFQELGLTFFNASLAPLDGLHVHYGDAVPDQDGMRPRLDEWADGGEMAPLGLLTKDVILSLDARLREVESVAADVALLPVCAYAHDDDDAAREILRLALGGVPAAETPQPRGALAQRALDLEKTIESKWTLVHGTRGSPEEVAALLTRARLDQQRFLYVVGRAPRIVSDREFLELRRDGAGNPLGAVNTIFYGNAETNVAWEWLGRIDLRVAGRDPRGEAREQEPGTGARFGFERVRAQLPAGGLVRVLLLFDSGLEGTRLGALIDPLALPFEPDFAVADRALVEARGLPADPKEW